MAAMADDSLREERSLKRILFVSAGALGVVVISAVALWWAMDRRGPRPAEVLDPVQEAAHLGRELESGWGKSSFITAQDPAGPGEQVSAFDGFAVRVESTPEGARVTAGGRELGTTPLATGIACTPGEELRVRIERQRYRTVERTTHCRKDALVTIRVALALR
jgi:hypothetical protein